MPETKNPSAAPAFNPKVQDAIRTLKGENSPQNLNAVLNELVRSPLLAPAVFDLKGKPAPKPAADGRVQLPKDTKISLVLVNSPEDKRYYLGFSSWDTLRAWQKAAKAKPTQQVVVLRFDEFANMLEKNPEASGLLVDAGDNALRLEAPLIASVKKQKELMAEAVRRRSAAAIQPGDKVTIVEPSAMPDALLDPICAVLADAPGVGSAYLQIMIVNDEKKSYLLVLDGPKDDKLFTAVAKAAQPYMNAREQKIPLNITTSITPLGQQGMRGSEPFYRKGVGRVVEEDDDE